jgi:hypothetical protein
LRDDGAPGSSLVLALVQRFTSKGRAAMVPALALIEPEPALPRLQHLGLAVVSPSYVVRTTPIVLIMAQRDREAKT